MLGRCQGRRGVNLLLFVLLVVITTILGGFVFLSWFGLNTDRYYLNPTLARVIPAGTCACRSATVFQCESCLTCASDSLASSLDTSPTSPSQSFSSPTAPSSQQWSYQYGRDDRNEGLNKAQCLAAFPGLYEDIHRASKYWKSKRNGSISTATLDAIKLKPGMVRARISNGDLFVIATRAVGEDHRRKIVAVLGSIHRALVAQRNWDPHEYKNTHGTVHPSPSNQDFEFVFSIEDRIDDVTLPEFPVWVLARMPGEEAAWLMPDFGFWAWENQWNSLGPYSQVVDRIARTEPPWDAKKQQLVWRGKPSFAPKLRRALIEAARDKPWDDVRQVDWYEHTNIINMEDHCNYMFIAHVEGRSYSASLKYRQACHSVVVAHRLQFIQHHHYLLVSSGPHQNFVEVERNFTDLASKIEPLIQDPNEAERIANNSVKVFRERYLTPAAEACYWRMLLEAYEGLFSSSSSSSSSSSYSSSSAPWPEKGHGDDRVYERGLRYESFVLIESEKMLAFDFTKLRT